MVVRPPTMQLQDQAVGSPLRVVQARVVEPFVLQAVRRRGGHGRRTSERAAEQVPGRSCSMTRRHAHDDQRLRSHARTVAADAAGKRRSDLVLLVGSGWVGGGAGRGWAGCAIGGCGGWCSGCRSQRRRRRCRPGAPRPGRALRPTAAPPRSSTSGAAGSGAGGGASCASGRTLVSGSNRAPPIRRTQGPTGVIDTSVVSGTGLNPLPVLIASVCWRHRGRASLGPGPTGGHQGRRHPLRPRRHPGAGRRPKRPNRLLPSGSAVGLSAPPSGPTSPAVGPTSRSRRCPRCS